MLNWETSFRGTIIDFRYVETVSPDSPPLLLSSPLVRVLRTPSSLSGYVAVAYACFAPFERNRGEKNRYRPSLVSARIGRHYRQRRRRGRGKARFEMEKSNFSTQRVLDRGGAEEIRFVIGFVGRETWLPRDRSIFRAEFFRHVLRRFIAG